MGAKYLRAPLREVTSEALVTGWTLRKGYAARGRLCACYAIPIRSWNS